MIQEASDGAGQLRRYHVPDGLSPEQKFDHWRHWYGSAVETPMRLERTESPIGASFNPTAASFEAPGFSIIEVDNEPVAGYWERNPDSKDLRLVFLKHAPSVTLFSPGALPVSSGYVGFLDVARSGGFEAPAGLHALQVNIDRSRLDLDDRSYRRLLRLHNLNQHALVKSFVVPFLLNWQQPGIAGEASGVADILQSVVMSLAGSLLEVPADGSVLGPGRRLAVREYVKANYRNKDLRPDGIAARFKVSRRTLFHLFEDEPLSLAAYIRTLRTVRALKLLTDPGSHRIPFTEIAQASGFSDLQAMRRAMKETTGLTVRDARQNQSLARNTVVKLQESLVR